MWEIEAASRASMENGAEEGLGDSSDLSSLAYPQEIHMEIDHEPNRTNNLQATTRRHLDQMVPSITSSSLRTEDEEVNNVVRQFNSAASHTERDGGVVPVWSPSLNLNRSEHFVSEETTIRAGTYLPRHSQTHQVMNWRQLSPSGVVPVWSPSLNFDVCVRACVCVYISKLFLFESLIMVKENS
ncbi:Cryptochrome-1 [Platanthera guangdongensis]|uniref:Cryptochrome-1 n=1 Tax=Platanthera guangdongensis TaxID=2320717 RepID=A0ABR2N4S4_9ASPA